MAAGRPFNKTHPLGQRMDALGLSVARVSAQTGIYVRTMSDYLANRIPMTREHRHVLASYLGMEPVELDPTTPPTNPRVPLQAPKLHVISR